MNQEQIEEYLNNMLETSEREIDQVFAGRLKTLLDLLGTLYRKYSEDGAISRSEVYAYNRFEKEMERIKEMIHSDYQVIFKEIDALMQAQYLQNYLRSAYVYEMSTLVRMQYRIPTAQMIKQAIANPIIDLQLPNILTENRNEVVRRIRIELAQGILAGESYSVMASRIENIMGENRDSGARYKAKRVARTEAGRAQSLGRLQSAEHAQKYANLDKRWLSSRDLSVRHSHRVLDGQKAGEDGLFEYKGHKAPAPSLFGVPWLDIQCRCDTIFLIAGKSPETIRVRDYGDAQYQQRLAERIDYLMSDEGLTEKQATEKAKRQIYPPNIVEKYRNYEDWLKDQPKGA